jgi:hypothetical protein
MRPKLLTPKNILLILVAAAIFGSLAFWIKSGMPLPGSGVPSTAGKIAFISTRSGQSDLWMMDSADGGNAVALTKDEAGDSTPTWNREGSELSFVSTNRSGVTPQVFRMDAMLNAKILQVTNTKSTKYDPRYGPEDLLLYMDTGKLLASDVKSNDSEAILPPADLRMQFSPFMEQGGFERVRISPDGKKYLAVLKLEDAEALVMYIPEGQLLILFGVAKKVHAAFKPDSSFAAVFDQGTPGAQPLLMYKEGAEQDENFRTVPLDQLRPMTEDSLFVFYDAEGTIQGAPNPVPVAPDYMDVSPDGKYAVFVFEKEESPFKGVFRVPMDPADTKIKPLFDKVASHPTWSPDSSTVAFVHDGDIYTVSAEGGEARNLTNGQGRSSEPVWSPAVAKK